VRARERLKVRFDFVASFFCFLKKKQLKLLETRNKNDERSNLGALHLVSISVSISNFKGYDV